MRATLAKLHAVCALHQSKNVSSCHASTVLDRSSDMLPAPIALIWDAFAYVVAEFCTRVLLAPAKSELHTRVRRANRWRSN